MSLIRFTGVLLAVTSGVNIDNKWLPVQQNRCSLIKLMRCSIHPSPLQPAASKSLASCLTCRCGLLRVQVFNDINAIEPLKRLAAGTDPLAARFAAQALHYIGEEVPHKLSQQVPLWTTQDVVRWLRQVRWWLPHALKYIIPVIWSIILLSSLTIGS